MKNIKKQKYVYFALPILILVILFFVFTGGNGESFETTTVKTGDLENKVIVTGKVRPIDSAELAFEKGGLLSSIKVKVGDQVKAGQILASLDTGEVYSSLKSAEANFQAEKSIYNETLNGTRKEELSVTETKFKNAERSILDAQRNLLNEIRNLFVGIESVNSKIGVLYNNPDSTRPDLKINVSSDKKEDTLDANKLLINEALQDWRREYSLLVNPNSELLQFSVNSALLVKQTVDLITDVVINNNNLTSYKDTVLDASLEITTAYSSFLTAQSNYTNSLSDYNVAKGEFGLKQAGSTSDSINTQKAKMDQAEAQVLLYQAQLRKSSIISPIDGIVTKVDPKVGEIVSAGTQAFAVMGEGGFKVEVQVPEVDIALINEGDITTIYLDAYGNSISFSGKVISVDPAETIVEGIPTYKVTVLFDTKDERIRSGMTADLHIIAEKKINSKYIPYSSVVKNMYVRVPSENIKGQKYEEIQVSTGIRSSDGNIELISGLNEGDTIITKINK